MLVANKVTEVSNYFWNRPRTETEHIFFFVSKRDYNYLFAVRGTYKCVEGILNIHNIVVGWINNVAFKFHWEKFPCLQYINKHYSTQPRSLWSSTRRRLSCYSFWALSVSWYRLVISGCLCQFDVENKKGPSTDSWWTPVHNRLLLYRS